MGVFNRIDFISEELKELPGMDRKPTGGVKSFESRAVYAISLAMKEKEIFFFASLQWLAIAIAYYIWVQMLDWIPEEVWRSTENSNNGSIADLVLLAWSFVCVGIAAFPIGILTGCMGATHFLHKQGEEATVKRSLSLVLPQSWPLWTFHWIDGWITVRQILERLPQKNDRRTAADKALSEAMYYAWKVGVAGILPSIVTGNGLIRSAKNSVVFVKDNFIEVAKLRAGYSALCWIAGIGAYGLTILFFVAIDLDIGGDKLYSNIYTFYVWAGVPLLVGVAVVMLLLRPIFVLAMCDLYSEHLDERGVGVKLPKNPKRSSSALIAFIVLCFLLLEVYIFRVELGIIDMLSTPYGQDY